MHMEPHFYHAYDDLLREVGFEDDGIPDSSMETWDLYADRCPAALSIRLRNALQQGSTVSSLRRNDI
jgi:hypothetical protein